MLRKRLQWIKNDDKMIQSEGGVDALSEDELREDCRERGMLGLRSVEEMRQQLRDWLDLSLNHSVPSSLLILSRSMGSIVSRQGVVADVVQSQRKLSKIRSFASDRSFHQKTPDQANLLEDLNKIWIGSHHLFASIARFDRKQNSQPNQSHQKQSNNTKPHETGHASHTTGGRSYASVLNGKEGTQKPVLAGPITKNITLTLENSDLLELSDTKDFQV
ncbi:mitochondrial proton/calcium exchanger protein-like protein [Tanacetum coccineum]